MIGFDSLPSCESPVRVLDDYVDYLDRFELRSWVSIISPDDPAFVAAAAASGKRINAENALCVRVVHPELLENTQASVRGDLRPNAAVALVEALVAANVPRQVICTPERPFSVYIVVENPSHGFQESFEKALTRPSRASAHGPVGRAVLDAPSSVS